MHRTRAGERAAGGVLIGTSDYKPGEFPNAAQHCGARVYGLELGCWRSDIRWVGTVVSCQVVSERLLVEVVEDGLVSGVRVVDVIVVL